MVSYHLQKTRPRKSTAQCGINSVLSLEEIHKI